MDSLEKTVLGAMDRHLDKRGLGYSKNDSPLFSDAQYLAFQQASLVCATVSLLLLSVTCYWFIRMKRSFRHQLILILVISDMWRSVIYIVYPLVVWTKGPQTQGMGFCTAVGFFTAYSLEAADLAILIIAIHSALYIFRPPSRPGKGGLYRYRHTVYATWLILPAVMASLAFLNKQNAYVSVASVCYLPVRPFWYRLALAWVPRYLIFFIICAIYAAIYIYVSVKFKGFNSVVAKDGDNDTTSNNVTTEDGFSRNDSVMMGPVRWDAKTNAPTRGDESIGSSSSATAKASDSSRRGSLNAASENKPDWESCGFLTTALASPPITTGEQGNPFDNMPMPISGAVTPRGTAEAPQPSNADVEDFAPDATPARPPLHTKDTMVSNSSRTFTQRFTDAATASSRPRPARQLSSVQKTRLAIRRQLRFLFIYPMVYILLWIIPFCSHALGYNDYLAAHPPFWLYILASMVLALQGAVNALVFSWRERPWDRLHATSETRFARQSLSVGNRFRKTNREMNLEDGLPDHEKVSEGADRRETFGGATVCGDGSGNRNGSAERKMSLSMPVAKHWWERHNSTATYDSRV